MPTLLSLRDSSQAHWFPPGKCFSVGHVYPSLCWPPTTTTSQHMHALSLHYVCTHARTGQCSSVSGGLHGLAGLLTIGRADPALPPAPVVRRLP
eukprot:scaffold116185_cov17-Tisochrysis_lutea.AAC.1